MSREKMDNENFLKIRRNIINKEGNYRTRALKIFPWVCGQCGRDFKGKRLRELTVHHRDHNHNNNPSDGSNWELLCIYCHDNEHSRHQVADLVSKGENLTKDKNDDSFKQNPFAKLNDMLCKAKINS